MIREKEIAMKMKILAPLISAVVMIAAMTGCFSSSKEVVHDAPPPQNTTIVEPPAR
jgi:hypothetical protein